MRDYIKSMQAILTATFLLLGSHAVADSCCLEPCDVNCCVDSCTAGLVYVQADALYLRAEEAGLSGCGPTVEVDTNESNLRVTRVLRNCDNPKFDWNWGYRIAAGLKFPCNSWEIGAVWMHYTQGESHIPDFCVDASKWKLKLNYVDALVGYRMEVACLRFKFFGGLRGAIVDQDLRSNFISTFIDDTGAPEADECKLTRHCSKQKFKGIGPLLGLEANWDFGCGFNLFVNGDLGCMYARYHTTDHTADLFETATYISNRKCKQDSCQFFVDAALGMRWKVFLCSNVKLTLQVSVEQHTLFEHDFIGDKGNLNLYGAAFGAALEF